MAVLKTTYNFAADYNCGTYGAGTYQNAACGTSPSTGGGLADTGYDILLPIFLGIALAAASVILLAKRWLRKRRSQVQA